MTRKEKLRDRAYRYSSGREDLGGPVYEAARGWEQGYHICMSDVRKLVGKAGVPSKLVRFLRPLR